MWSTALFSAIGLTFLWSTFTVPSMALPSPDGSCGKISNTTSYECWEGSDAGSCCSAYGWCGNSTTHCGVGCNPLYGKCDETLPKLTPDGTCGGTNGYICHGSYGTCCSSYGYCGSSAAANCGVGCQQTFSVDGACLTGVKPTIDGTCGATKNLTCTGSASWNGQCCSAGGYCGTSPAHCGGGCQAAFGTGCL